MLRAVRGFAERASSQTLFKDAQADKCMKTLDVLWKLPVGCDFSGFFVEILTLIQPLVRTFDFRLDIGSCSDTMLKVPPAPAHQTPITPFLFDLMHHLCCFLNLINPHPLPPPAAAASAQ